MNVEDIEQGVELDGHGLEGWRRSYTRKIQIDRRVGPYELRVCRRKKADQHVEWEIGTFMPSFWVEARGREPGWHTGVAAAELALAGILHSMLSEVES